MTCRTAGHRPLPYTQPLDYAVTPPKRRHWNPLHGKHVVIRGDIIGETIVCVGLMLVLGIDWGSVIEALL